MDVSSVIEQLTNAAKAGNSALEELEAMNAQDAQELERIEAEIKAKLKEYATIFDQVIDRDKKRYEITSLMNKDIENTHVKSFTVIEQYLNVQYETPRYDDIKGVMLMSEHGSTSITDEDTNTKPVIKIESIDDYTDDGVKASDDNTTIVEAPARSTTKSTVPEVRTSDTESNDSSDSSDEYDVTLFIDNNTDEQGDNPNTPSETQDTAIVNTNGVTPVPNTGIQVIHNTQGTKAGTQGRPNKTETPKNKDNIRYDWSLTHQLPPEEIAKGMAEVAKTVTFANGDIYGTVGYTNKDDEPDTDVIDTTVVEDNATSDDSTGEPVPDTHEPTDNTYSTLEDAPDTAVDDNETRTPVDSDIPDTTESVDVGETEPEDTETGVDDTPDEVDTSNDDKVTENLVLSMFDDDEDEWDVL